MKEKHSTNFVIGFILGALICVVVWYWQKSTAADEGALDLLDRMAELDRKLRGRETAVSTSSREPVSTSSRQAVPTPPKLTISVPAQQAASPLPDDLQRIKGIGPVFDGRLRQENIDSFVKLAAISVEKLAKILDISENRAATILDNVRSIG